MSDYRIERVSADDEHDTLFELHEHCFGQGAAIPEWDEASWWIAYKEFDPVAFAGLATSVNYEGGYLCRSGVRSDHRGRGLQLRLIRVRERKAREFGWTTLVTDTTDNVASSNTLIRAGYKLFVPENPWAFKSSLYWKKEIQ